MKDNRIAQNISLDFTGAMADVIGEKHGISDKQLAELQGRTAEIHSHLQKLTQNGKTNFFNLPQADTKPFKKFATRVREKFENFVVLGIGGSALGTSGVHGALQHSFSHLLTKRKRNGYPKLFVIDNIDPDLFDEFLNTVDLKKTIFNVISKSGTTAETMAQFMIIQHKLQEKLKGKWKKRIVVTTGSKGVLRSIVEKHKLTSFEVPEEVGGRFSVLSSVGLLPLACTGIDIDALLAGAAQMASLCKTDNFSENPAYLTGALLYLADTAKHKPMAVMMPYSTKLYGMADWFCQLWAESLGKRHTLDGAQVNSGQTPIKALGVTDQHSQIQLYVEGPPNKIIIFVEIEKFAKRVPIPEIFADKPELSYLAGSSLNELLKVELDGTRYAISTHDRPSITIKLPELSANALGQFIFMMEVATAFAGGLYRVNPFDQPGVEFGKNYAYAVMGRKGYEKLKEEIGAL